MHAVHAVLASTVIQSFYATVSRHLATTSQCDSCVCTGSHISRDLPTVTAVTTPNVVQVTLLPMRFAG